MISKKILPLVLSLALILSGFSYFTLDTKANTIYQATELSKLSELDSTNILATGVASKNNTFNVTFSVKNDCYVKASGSFQSSDYVSINADIYSQNLTDEYTDTFSSDYYASSSNNKPTTINTYAKLKKGTYTIVYSTTYNSSAKINVRIGAVYNTNIANVSFVKEINSSSALVKVNSIEPINKVYLDTSNYSNTHANTVKSIGDVVELDSNNQFIVPLKDNGYYNFLNILVVDKNGFGILINKRIMTQSITHIKGITNKKYTGKPITQKISEIYVGWYTGAIPTYNITYNNNVNVGTATMTLTGTGMWIGKVTKTFKILKSNAKSKDKTKPTVKGVKNNKTYKKAVKIRFFDASGIKKATLNGKKIKSGKKVKKNGKYKLVVVDNAGNKRVIKFKIKKK